MFRQCFFYLTTTTMLYKDWIKQLSIHCLVITLHEFIIPGTALHRKQSAEVPVKVISSIPRVRQASKDSSVAVSSHQRLNNVKAHRIHAPSPARTCRQRIRLVTKEGATVASVPGVATVALHGTSIPPPVAGGPPVFTTRPNIRTSSAASTTTPSSTSTTSVSTVASTSASTATATPTASSSSTTGTSATSTTSAASSSSSTGGTSTPTAARTTASSTAFSITTKSSTTTAALCPEGTGTARSSDACYSVTTLPGKCCGVGYYCHMDIYCTCPGCAG